MSDEKKAKRVRFDLGELTPHNIKQLKLINEVIFPMPYSPQFYKDALAAGEHAKLVYHDDIVVGGVCCRVEPRSKDSKEKQLYIMTLGCLAPYRRRGLGNCMLNHVHELAKNDAEVTSVCLHVQTSNDDAIAFYKKHGYEVTETLKDYYKRIESPDAYLLRKELNSK